MHIVSLPVLEAITSTVWGQQRYGVDVSGPQAQVRRCKRSQRWKGWSEHPDLIGVLIHLDGPTGR